MTTKTHDGNEPQPSLHGTPAGTRQSPAFSQDAVPTTAKWLGALGASPFVILSVSHFFLEGSLEAQASFALALYGALILSFVGGIHWGLAIAETGREQSVCTIARRLAISVIPSLTGWGALFLSPPAGFLILAAAFVCVLLYDVGATRKAEAPAWYPRLRLPLTLVVAAPLVAAAVA